MDKLPFRLELLGKVYYVVNDGGNRSRSLVDSLNRIATPEEVALWGLLQSPKSEPRRQRQPA